MWIKLHNELYNLDRIFGISTGCCVIGQRASYSIQFYQAPHAHDYDSIYFDSQVERDFVYECIQSLLKDTSVKFCDLDAIIEQETKKQCWDRQSLESLG